MSTLSESELQNLLESHQRYEAERKQREISMVQPKPPVEPVRTLKKKRKREEKAPWCNRTGLQGYLHQDLSPKEQKLLDSIQTLPTLWGYRSGPEGAHAAYEARLHAESSHLYPLTDITDVLFRTLSARRAYPSDYVKKLRHALNTLEFYRNQSSLLKETTLFLNHFLTDNPTAQRDLKRLSQIPIQEEPYNPWVVALVVSSQIIQQLAQGDIQRAIEIARKYNECISKSVN